MKHPNKVIISTVLCAVMEFFDFSLYGQLASILSDVFFKSHDDGLMALAYTFGIYATAFFARPVGAFFFGHIGDTKGRKSALIYSIYIMLFSTFGLALIPSYESIGGFAMLLLLVCRVGQGFALGGDTSSAPLLVEALPEGKKFFAGAYYAAGSGGGILLSSAVSAILLSVLSHEQMCTFGWRIGFFIGGCIAIVCFFVRSGMEDSEEFIKCEKHNNPLLEVLRKHKREFIIAMMLVACNTNIVYTFFFIPSLKAKVLNMDLSSAMWFNTMVMLILTFLPFIFSRIADRIGPIKIYTVAITSFAIGYYPMFKFILSDGLIAQSIGYMTFAILFSMIVSVEFGFISMLFPTNVRVSGMSVAYNISVSLFGGTISGIDTLLIHYTGDIMSPAYYTMSFTIFGIVAVWMVSRNYTHKQ